MPSPRKRLVYVLAIKNAIVTSKAQSLWRSKLWLSLSISLFYFVCLSLAYLQNFACA